MAEDTAAARERVLAARAALGDELTLLEASGRAAVDIPARIKRSPAKAAAVVGGVGFLALKGPQRLFGAARQAITGKPAPLPKSMLPDEVEKTLRKLGRDGDKIRGALERDFADYAKQARKEREGVKTALLMAAVRPLLSKGAKAASDRLLTSDSREIRKRMDEIKERVREATTQAAAGQQGDQTDGDTRQRQ